MGHFTIDLPENKKGDVRWGTLRKMQFPLFHKRKSESKKGYFVQVSDSIGNSDYRLFRSKEGVWSTDPDGKTGLDKDILFVIKDAIIEKENQ